MSDKPRAGDKLCMHDIPTERVNCPECGGPTRPGIPDFIGDKHAVTQSEPAANEARLDDESFERLLAGNTIDRLVLYEARRARASEDALRAKVKRATEALRKIADANPDAAPTMEWAIASDAIKELEETKW